jgi:hypothetical protein
MDVRRKGVNLKFSKKKFQIICSSFNHCSITTFFPQLHNHAWHIRWLEYASNMSETMQGQKNKHPKQENKKTCPSTLTIPSFSCRIFIYFLYYHSCNNNKSFQKLRHFQRGGH